ncbi:MAG: lysophospholipid acyltransferase family protein [Nocardioides sp.]
MTVRKLQQKRGWTFILAVPIVKSTMLTIASRDWVDGDKIPATGGCIVAVNHISHIDPLLSAHFVYDHGRLPRYLAKSGLFKNKALAGFLRSAGQIPVERLTRHAVGAFDAAVQAVRAGECVVVYPEGTLTRDPDLWPMQGKSGAARIALETGCPVIPVGQWGAQGLLPPYSAKLRLVPRQMIKMKAGDPVDLSDLLTQPRNAATIHEATARIMAAIVDLVADLRDEAPPVELFDARKAGVREIGDPRKKGESS